MNAIESTLLETLEDAKENVQRAFAHRRRVVEGHEKALAQADALVEQAVEIRDRAMVLVQNYNRLKREAKEV